MTRKTTIISSSIVAFGLIGTLIVANSSNQPVATKTIEDKAVIAEDSSYFLFISDIHLNTGDAGPSVPGNDTGVDLWKLAKAKLLSITTGKNPPKFIIYTGDLPGHNPDNGSIHDTNVLTVLDDLVEIAHGIPLFYAPGNNDPLDGDYLAFSDSQCRTPLSLVKGKGYPAPNAAQIYNQDATHGYYSATPFKGLRIIGMNTVMFTNSQRGYTDPECASDPEDRSQASALQIKWLKQELKSAALNKEKVYLIMHIPPGVDAYNSGLMWKDNGYEDSLLAFVNSYESIVSGVFYGHTHMDEVRRLTVPGNTSLFSEIALSAPGISPIFDNNPGFKKVYYNQAYEPIDFTTYYTTFSNNRYGINGEWGNLSYTFRQNYGAGKTIKETLGRMPLDTLFQRMMHVYMVKSSLKSANQYVENGITVN